jgi:hypothetical protein
MIYYFILILIFFGFIIWREIYFRKVEKDLLNRIMSKNYSEYVFTKTTDDKTNKKVHEPSKQELEEEAIRKEFGINREV